MLDAWMHDVLLEINITICDISKKHTFEKTQI